MKSSRTHNALINSSVLAVLQVLTILLRFVTQTIFIHYLGKKYLGLNGLFLNIINILGFADLGIDTSIVYALYKPLAEHDEEKVTALMNLFRRAYNVIGLVVAGVGIILLPFLPYLIKDYHAVSHIPMYYLLYLANAVVIYFFTYKRSLLIADQQEYVSSLNQFNFTLLQTVFQAAVLFVFKAYSLYLWVAIICTLLSNLRISRKVDKQYPYLAKHKHERVSHEEFISIRNNVAGMIGARIGSVVVRSTDNLLLSTFAGLAVVGIYSNYLLIVNSVVSVLTKLVSSVTASIGNLIVEREDQDVRRVYLDHFMINFFLVTLTAGCLLTAFNTFIQLWAGPNYVLPTVTVAVIVINYFVDMLRQTSITFVSAYGLFVPNGKKSVFEAIINLALSLFLLVGCHLGIAGVLLGTTLTNLLLNSWFEPWMIYSRGFRSQRQWFKRFYFRTYWMNMVFMLVVLFLINWGITWLDQMLHFNLVIQLVFNLAVMVISLLIVLTVVYGRTPSYQYMWNLVKKFRKII